MVRNEVAVAPVGSLLGGHFESSGTLAVPYLIQNKEDYKHFVHCACTNELSNEKFKWSMISIFWMIQ